ncbi:MAG: D-serine ammonia-lyase, partial [Firmicutes bacterium]|nr:D-serine ammonia-lyase [Bacillota bacterium]
MNIEELKKENPVIEEIAACREAFWNNPNCLCDCAAAAAGESGAAGSAEPGATGEKLVDIDEAEARLLRFAPFIQKVYPEVLDGIIESDLTEIPDMKEALAMDTGGVLDPVTIPGRLFLKCDSHLPISGSVKARGGIYEVLKFAEQVAMDNGMLTEGDDYSILAEPRFQELFGRYSVAVGSTGNLGLSIGIMSAKLGFQVTVHMSADARQWKKDMLRGKGVIVKEYPDDYEAAVAQGRREAEADPNCHFVDDENSLDLFAGYSVAGKRLKQQLRAQGV